MTGFNLYQEGGLVCQVVDATATSMDCTVTLVNNSTQFTLTATFADGSESPHSAPFLFSTSDEEDEEVSADTEETEGSTSAPSISLTTSTAAGTVPLTVTFDASASSVSDGVELVSFFWDFGDGATGETANISHVYTEPGTFSATVTVTDSLNQQSSVSTPIIVGESAESTTVDTTTLNTSRTADVTTTSNAEDTQSDDSAVSASSATTVDLHLEMGDVQVAGDWVRVSFAEPYERPIVIAGPPQSADTDPCTVRIRNVTTDGFDLRLTEWPYQDGEHGQEQVSYLVVEEGTSTLEDGSVIVAGSFSGTTNWRQVNFPTSFTQTPVVLTSVTSVNEAEAVTGRVLPGTASFSYRLQNEEGAENAHGAETVHYVAWAAGSGSQEAFQYRAVAGDVYLTDAWQTLSLGQRFLQAPLLFAQIRSNASLDTAALRLESVAQTEFTAKIEEEQSMDREVEHPAEQVSYLAVAPVGTLRLATFSWDFPQEQESDILGFRIYANGEEVCATDDSTVRTLGCTLSAPTQSTSYTIAAIINEEEVSATSNAITLTL